MSSSVRNVHQNVQLVFRGEVLDGFRADEVRSRLAQALKLDEQRVAQLFSGARTVLKRSVEPGLARGYADKLARLGARVHLEPSDAPPTTGFAPLPELPEVPESNEAPPPPWGTPPRPTRPAPLSPYAQPGLTQIAAARAPSADALALEPLDEVTCPNCNERQSKRLLCRNCTTNIPMALAAKEEEADKARAARQDAFNAKNGRRTQPATLSPLSGRSAAASSAPGFFGFGLEGRMARLKYATGNIVAWALFYIPLSMWLQRPTAGRLVFTLIVGALLTVIGIRAAVLRCHDCDKSGWWSMLLWLPTVNAIVTLVLAFAPGTDGDNDYGEQPPPSSWWAFGIAAVCALLLFALTFSHLMTAMERMADERQEDDGIVQFQSDPVAASLPSRDAQAAFNEAYLLAKRHKAFAVSPSGGWGFAVGRGSQADAARGAMQECESRRAAYTGPCVLVNMDGQWAQSR
jgi:uncharacterized membrane protein YhaH (DUF805 family)